MLENGDIPASEILERRKRAARLAERLERLFN